MVLLAFILLSILVSMVVTMRRLIFSGPSYRTVAICAIENSFIVMLTLMICNFSGKPFRAFLQTVAAENSRIIADNPQFANAFGFSVSNASELAGVLEKAYMAVFDMLPAMILIISAIIAYFSQVFICHTLAKRKEIKVIEIGRKKTSETDGEEEIFKKKLEHFPEMVPLREFSVPDNCGIGFFLMLLLSELVNYFAQPWAGIVLFNVMSVIVFVLTVQGLSVLFAFCHERNISHAVAVVLSIIILFIEILQMLFALLGTIDLILGLKKRIAKKSENLKNMRN